VGDLDGWPVFPRRMVVVKIKKREAIPEADNRLMSPPSRRTSARRRSSKARRRAWGVW
jgi:hypothetical protein